MLLRPSDAPLSDEEVRRFLETHAFGQLIAPGAGRDLPVVVPSHFAMRDARTLLVHFARPNPVWRALEERPRALFSVVGDYVYVPSDWNAGEEAPPEWGVPTSYYAAVQLECDVRIVDDAEEMARLLSELMRTFQPEGGHEPVRAGDNPYGRQFGAIRGAELTVTSTRAKFKFGGNRPLAHRLAVAQKLAERDAPLDAEAREHVLRRSSR